MGLLNFVLFTKNRVFKHEFYPKSFLFFFIFVVGGGKHHIPSVFVVFTDRMWNLYWDGCFSICNIGLISGLEARLGPSLCFCQQVQTATGAVIDKSSVRSHTDHIISTSVLFLEI